MARPEGESSKSPEYGGLLRVDPAELMRDNPAALIVNQRQYDTMAGHFSIDMWEPPQVVRVATFSAGRGEVVKHFILDGMTRTKYVSENPAKIASENPDFHFEARDVTDSVLRNPLITGGRRDPNQTALTIVQYLTAVVSPTVVHSQIAADRIATHIVNGWENMVGGDLAKKYSALAALSLIGKSQVAENGFKRDLARHSKLMVNETIDERGKLDRAFFDMAAVVRTVVSLKGPGPMEIARSAFELVSLMSPVIGGEREAKRQIFGLLHMIEVSRKLAEAFPGGEVEQMRAELGEALLDSFKRVGQQTYKGDRESALTALGTALNDPILNFSYVKDIFESRDPVARYDEARREVNVDRLAKTYQVLHRTQILTPTETQLVATLGNVGQLDQSRLEALTRVIKSADTVFKKGESARLKFEIDRDQLIAQGVSVALLDEINTSIQSKIEAIAPEGAISEQQVRGAMQSLNLTLEDINRRLNRQITTFKLGEVVDKLTGDKLKQGYGPQIRSDIIGLVMGEFPTMDDRNRHIVSRRVSELSSLDNDLLLKVKTANITLSVALASQRQREEEARRRANIQVVPLQPSPDQAPAPSISPVRPVTPDLVAVVAPIEAVMLTPIPTSPGSPESDGVDDVVSRADLDERRKVINREKLTNLTDALDKALDKIDLRKEDLTSVEQIAMDNIIRRLGKLAYGHPDIVRVVTTDYKALENRVRVLTEALNHNQTELAQRDARTGR